MENVTDLEPLDNSFDWFFEVQCNSCHEKHPKFVTLNSLEEHDTSGAGGKVHFAWRCGFCKRESSAKFDQKFVITPYKIEKNNQFQPLLEIECRGLEFVGFDPKGIWKCAGTESSPRTIFSEVDLEEKEWTDYDEKAAQPVQIMGFESKWERA